MYFRFIICLTIGLLGVALVLRTLFDALFLDWNFVEDFRKMFSGFGRKRQRYVLLDGPNGKTRLSTRLIEERRRVSRAREQEFLPSIEPAAGIRIQPVARLSTSETVQPAS